MNIMGCNNKKYMNFEGYYSNQQKFDAVATFFRFYPDGTVTASLPVTVNHVIAFKPNQLDKDNSKECTIRGKYTLNGNKVKFKLVDKNGSADFSGEFRENKVILTSHNNINGRDSEETFDFYHW
jgi:hypothetical protein